VNSRCGVVELTLDTHFQKDEGKPDGEACNVDGTLKDATDMEWLNSPSQLLPSPPLKRLLDYDSDLDSDHEDQRINKKAQVSSCF